MSEVQVSSQQALSSPSTTTASRQQNPKMTYLLKQTTQLRVSAHPRHSRHPEWLSAGVSAASTSWTRSERGTEDRAVT